MRLILFFLLNCAATVLRYFGAGGDPTNLEQPFELMIIIGLVVGNIGAAGQMRLWRQLVAVLFTSKDEKWAAVTPGDRRDMRRALREARVTARVAGGMTTLLGLTYTGYNFAAVGTAIAARQAGGSLLGLFYGVLIADFLLAPAAERLERGFERILAR